MLVDLVGFYGISTIVGYVIPNPFLYILIAQLQTIQFSISTGLVDTHLKEKKTVLFQTIQFSISKLFSSI